MENLLSISLWIKVCCRQNKQILCKISYFTNKKTCIQFLMEKQTFFHFKIQFLHPKFEESKYMVKAEIFFVILNKYLKI